MTYLCVLKSELQGAESLPLAPSLLKWQQCSGLGLAESSCQEPGNSSGHSCRDGALELWGHPPLLSQAYNQAVASKVEELGYKPVSMWVASVTGNGLAIMPQCLAFS